MIARVNPIDDAGPRPVESGRSVRSYAASVVAGLGEAVRARGLDSADVLQLLTADGEVLETLSASDLERCVCGILDDGRAPHRTRELRLVADRLGVLMDHPVDAY